MQRINITSWHHCSSLAHRSNGSALKATWEKTAPKKSSIGWIQLKAWTSTRCYKSNPPIIFSNCNQILCKQHQFYEIICKTIVTHSLEIGIVLMLRNRSVQPSAGHLVHEHVYANSTLDSEHPAVREVFHNFLLRTYMCYNYIYFFVYSAHRLVVLINTSYFVFEVVWSNCNILWQMYSINLEKESNKLCIFHGTL